MIDIPAIKKRCEAARKGIWEVAPDGYTVWADGDSGYVAQAHPFDPCKTANINFIAHARQDIPDLITEIERLRGDMEEIIVESGKVDIDNWPAQQQICQSIANKSLGRDVNGK